MMPFLSAVVAFVVGDVATLASLSGSALLMESYSFIPLFVSTIAISRVP
jgi:hypothetical protein